MSAWDRFWYAPASTATLGVLRAAFGLVICAWTVALAPDALTFFSNEGIVPVNPSTGYRWGLLAWFGSYAAVVALVVILFVAAACLAAGYRTRVAAIVTFVCLISLTRRDPLVTNSGDAVLRNIVLFLALAPSGAAFSVDRWRSDRAGFWHSPSAAPWALRLVQVQISMVYFFTVWSKLRGERWRGGTAVADALRVGDLQRFALPDALTDSLFLAHLMTWGTLAVEAALAVGVWNRKLRPWVLLLGVALHAFIELTFALGFFSLIMIASYIAFIPPETMQERIVRLRPRLRRSRFKRLRALAEPAEKPAGGPALRRPGAPLPVRR